MGINPWLIYSWPIIYCRPERTARFVNVFQHLGTVVNDDLDEFGRLHGHTVWGKDAKQIGLAWDWTEIVDGVFGLLDPMSIVSNVHLVDELGASVSELLKAVHLNRITHELPWQTFVKTATRKSHHVTPWSERLRLPVETLSMPSELAAFAVTR